MTNPKEPAFPYKIESNDEYSEYFGGLTKREYFAAMAMQGFCANTQFQFSCAEIASRKGSRVAEEMALAAKEIANTLIDELNKPE